jgi:hypothetical protein
MKKFVLRTLVFLLPLAVIGWFVFSLADGTTDALYARFTTPKQTSLIIGTSRAAQGIVASELNRSLKRDDIYNYAFTLGHSPFGPTYFESIKKKVDSTSSNGIFIVSVDPWSLCSKAEAVNSEAEFSEQERALNTPFVDLNPNVFYLLEHYDNQYSQIIFDKTKTKLPLFLHNDGWLEVSITMDSAAVQSRTKEKIEDYKKQCPPNSVISENRWGYFKKTIEYLDKYGDVVIVRMPTGKELLELEQVYFSNFTTRIQSFCSENKLKYLDMTDGSSKYQYTDGNHLYAPSSMQFTKELADRILMN